MIWNDFFHKLSCMIIRSTADFFFKLPLTKRRTVMLDAAKEATEMQRDVLKKAEKIRRAVEKSR
ncbi:hypothetical protein A2880_02150 [Candidatus Peribacteria bacterium RIFCSPHIGHO2_01_FULL_49_38]|nr:MAG: hypothetical protein A2880_02150 [Candidatus Peribacteria bacterium RIFCSPHIGHO2_01_FULL_49_38]